MLRWTIGAQAAYYLLSALWPLLSMNSFEAVTGPKTDLWLVRFVALLIIVIGLTLAGAVKAGRLPPEIIACALLSCIAFICVDTVYVFSDVISKIYLGDAVVELLLFVTIVVGLIGTKPTNRA